MFLEARRPAATLVRYSDIWFTLGVCTHVELHDQTAATEAERSLQPENMPAAFGPGNINQYAAWGG